VQPFDAAGAPLADPAAMAPEMLAAGFPAGGLLVAGDGAARAGAALAAAGRAARLAHALGPPDPVAVARLARHRWIPGAVPAVVRPLYLRAPDVTLSGVAR
jgi:hypothetical protein